jgi:hypothetical protein
VVGAGNGEVKSLNDGSAKIKDHTRNVVVAIEGTFAVVESL